MKKFAELLTPKTEKSKSVVFAFGRFNPPTSGHQKLIERIFTIAKRVKGKPVLYISSTQDKKRNPLTVKQKIKYIKAVAGYKSGIEIKAATGRERTFMEILKNRFDRQYSEVYMVAGSDRLNEFRKLINKYNGKDYHFNKVEVLPAGIRDPDSDKSDESISATKMRDYALANNFDKFKDGRMKGLGEKDTMALFKDLKKQMGVREFNMPTLEDEISNEKQKIREDYFENKTLMIGEMVENTTNGNVGKIIKRGANYISYEMEDGGIEKAWLHNVASAENIQSDLRNEEVNKKKLVLQKNSDQLEEEAYEIGADYANHTKEITPGEKPEKKRKDKKYNKLKVNDIKEWAEKEETLQKYKDRYSTNWRIKLDETVIKMMDKLTS